MSMRGAKMGDFNLSGKAAMISGMQFGDKMMRNKQ